MESRLYKLIVTKDDQVRLLDELSMLKNVLYREEDGLWEEVLKTKLRSDVAVIIEEELSCAGIDKNSYLREISKAVREMKEVRMTVAFSPSLEIMEKLGEVVKGYFGEMCLLQLNIDREILGGVIIDFGGRHMDLTLKESWEHVWENNGKYLLNLVGVS